MVKLRLKRIGKKQAPFYRIVAADSRVNRNGQYIELVGTFDPLKNEVKIDKELALKWLQNGAQPTDTVRDLFSKEGVMKELHEAKLASKSGQEPKVKKEKQVETAKPAAKKVVAKVEKQTEAEKAVKAAAAKVAKETVEAEQAKLEATKAAEAIAVAKAKEAEEAKILAEKEAKEQAEAQKAAKELAAKYAKEIAKSEAKTEAEAALAKKMSTKERAELDGSASIDEARSELQKHANKMRAIAKAKDIKIKDSNLRDMTKQELVKFMKQVSVKLNK